jgi:hypothetical protein
MRDCAVEGPCCHPARGLDEQSHDRRAVAAASATAMPVARRRIRSERAASERVRDFAVDVA